MVRDLVDSDIIEVTDIYNYYVRQERRYGIIGNLKILYQISYTKERKDFMKKSKILFLIMAFALTFMVAINVKAAGTCVSKGGTLPDSCSSVTCGSATVPAQCSSVAFSSCCTWQDPTCGENEQLVAHECVPVEPTTPTTCPAGQELNTEGTACVACRDHGYKAGDGLACSYCNGTVNASKTYCDEKKSEGKRYRAFKENFESINRGIRAKKQKIPLKQSIY